MTIDDLKKEKGLIEPNEVLLYARELMPDDEIDHYYSDLYLKVTQVSEIIVSKFKYKDMVKTFVSNREPHELWYEFPFCYWEKGCH